MKLYFIRHGRQNSSLCNVNVSLSKEGIEQAKLLGKRLAGPQFHIEKVYSSQLIRAVETATYVNEQLQVPYESIEGLREISFGQWEGKSDEEIDLQYKELKQKQALMEEDLPYPDGENTKQAYERFFNALAPILESKEEEVAIVAHGVVLRCFITGILKMPFSARKRIASSYENTSITEIHYNRQTKIFTLERLNDYAHLEGHDELLRKHFK